MNHSIRNCLQLSVCLLSVFAVLQPAWCDEWKLTLDQLSSHEQSYRIIVTSAGVKTAFLKASRTDTFQKTGEATIDDNSLRELRSLTFKLQTAFQQATLVKKSARDVDLRFRVLFERNGAEIELRWLAGQIGNDKALSQTYETMCKLVNSGNQLSLQLKPDPFGKLEP